MNLEYFLKKTQVIKIDAKEKQLVFKELLEHLQELNCITNKERYYAQIAHRESLENTGIGNGLAIPHARTDSVTDFISIFGILTEPIDYQSIDEKPVQFVLLSLFPTDMSTKYLYLIGMMARIFSNPEKRALFESDATPAKVYSHLNKEAKSYFEAISEMEGPSSGSPVNLAGVPSSDLDLLIRLDRLYQLLAENQKPEGVQKKIDELKKLIDNRSLTYFERMRKKSNNPFAIVEKDSCSGCHMAIPPFDMKKVKDREGISVCIHCGRFLIFI